MLVSAKYKNVLNACNFGRFKTLSGCRSCRHFVSQIATPIFFFAKMFSLCCAFALACEQAHLFRWGAATEKNGASPVLGCLCHL